MGARWRLRPCRALLLSARPRIVRSADAQWRRVRRRATSSSGDDRAMDGAAERRLEPRPGLGHTRHRIERRRLLLPAELRPHRLYRLDDVDRPGAWAVRRDGGEPG